MQCTNCTSANIIMDLFRQISFESPCKHPSINTCLFLSADLDMFVLLTAYTKAFFQAIDSLYLIAKPVIFCLRQTVGEEVATILAKSTNWFNVASIWVTRGKADELRFNLPLCNNL